MKGTGKLNIQCFTLVYATFSHRTGALNVVQWYDIPVLLSRGLVMDKILLITGILGLLAAGAWSVFWFLRWREDRKRERDLVFLQIMTPKKESKEDKEVESEQFSGTKDFREVLGVMDHLYQSLHSLYSHKHSRFYKGHPSGC